MTTQDRSAMDAEFDDAARWTLDAVRRLGADHAIPAACRGSASPAALDWLARACALGEGTPLVDVGGGMGGPAAYAASVFGARPVVVEPMLGACRTARRLFPTPVVQATGGRVPIRTGSVGAAWCLGVLCTVEDKASILAELRRIVRPGGHVGMMVLLATRSELGEVPEGNHFPTRGQLVRLVTRAGLDIVGEIDAGELADAPGYWRRRMDRVDASVAETHRGDPRQDQIQNQETLMHRLLACGEVTARLFHAVVR